MKKLLLLLMVVTVASCASVKDIAYFQDIPVEMEQQISAGKGITLQPNDMISIVVSSKDPELAMLFNLPKVQQIAGATGSATSSTSELSGYVVNSQGYIDFPILGKVFVEGKSREQVSELIKEQLASEQLLKDAVVTVNYLNLQFSVMGEVAKPGQYSITNERTTILDALSQAGDLSIYGGRRTVLLTRESEGKRISYKLDLTSSKMFDSPAFYIQQNDLIYVEPNQMRANQSTVNANNFNSASFWMSLTSLLTTLAVLLF